MIKYNIPLNKTNTTTLLSALIPVGGLIGALICVPLIPLLSRRYISCLCRYFLIYISIVSIIGDGLIQIPNFPCLVIGKLIQGICAGA